MGSGSGGRPCGAHRLVKDTAGADDDAGGAGEHDGIAGNLGGGTGDVCILVLQIDLGHGVGVDAKFREVDLVLILKLAAAEFASQGLRNSTSPPFQVMVPWRYFRVEPSSVFACSASQHCALFVGRILTIRQVPLTDAGMAWA
jgi:hypothetical protein